VAAEDGYLLYLLVPGELETEHAIWRLWEVTGHCEFEDITPIDLVRRGNLIADRYAAWLEANAKTSKRELAMQAIKENMALVQSNYCVPALCTLSRLIQTKGELASENMSYWVNHPPLREVRTELREHLVEWLDDHAKDLQWNKEGGCFTCKYTLPVSTKGLEQHMSGAWRTKRK